MTEYYRAKHAVTGIVGEYPVEYKDIPSLNDVLIPTDEDVDPLACESCLVPEDDNADQVVEDDNSGDDIPAAE